MGILNRWRQFGRRYFWPHLLLGMVAASLGLPHASACDRTTLSESSARSLNISSAVRSDRLALLQESARRPHFNVDYWHQHAIRTVIRHLSFTLTPANLPAAEQAMPLAVQKLALLNTLNALLTQEARPPAIVRQMTLPQRVSGVRYQTGLWLARVQGIKLNFIKLKNVSLYHFQKSRNERELVIYLSELNRDINHTFRKNFSNLFNDRDQIVFKAHEQTITSKLQIAKSIVQHQQYDVFHLDFYIF